MEMMRMALFLVVFTTIRYSQSSLLLDTQRIMNL